MSEQVLHGDDSEFANSLPPIDRFGGMANFNEIHIAIQAYCSPDEQHVALRYIEGTSAAEIADTTQFTEEQVKELILQAEHQIRRVRTKQRGKTMVRAARVAGTTKKRPAPKNAASITGQTSDAAASNDKDWQNKAACRDGDPDLAHNAKNNSPEERQFIDEYCNRCLVKTACLAWALDHHEDNGIWGGMTATQRKELSRGRKGTT